MEHKAVRSTSCGRPRRVSTWPTLAGKHGTHFKLR